MTKIVHKNYINGEWKNSHSKKIYDIYNPANTREKIGSAQYSSDADVNEAIIAADKAAKIWSGTPAPQRADILFKAHRIMQNRFDELAESITLEEGKCIGDAEGEVKRSLAVIEFMAGEGRRMHGYTAPSESQGTLDYTYRKPLGAVSVITPWNFPLAIPAWKIAPALVCGNTVVFKPAFSTPITAIKLVEIFEEAGLPKGVLNIVTGSSSDIGSHFVENEIIKGVSFTGSTEVGTEINKMASKSLAKVQCEMGGKNAVIVMDDGNLEKAQESILQGAFGSSGQRCTATSRAIIHQNIFDEFVKKLVSATNKICVGAGLNRESDMSCLASKAQLNQIQEYVDIGLSEGATLLTGGKKISNKDLEDGYFFQPTIFKDVETNMRIAKEEIFGPVLTLFKCQDIEEAIAISNDSEFGLSSSIYTENIHKAFTYIEQIETGIIHVNSPTLGGEVHMPFGGIKASGIGNREQGLEAIEFFTEIVSVYISH